jgi:hypothetical protein
MRILRRRVPGFAKVDGSHPWILRNLLRITFREDRTFNQHGDPPREVEDQVHVVFDQKYRHLRRKRRNGV